MATKVKAHSRVKTKGVKAHTRKGLESKAGAGKQYSIAKTNGYSRRGESNSLNDRINRRANQVDDAAWNKALSKTDKGEMKSAMKPVPKYPHTKKSGPRTGPNRRMRKHLAGKKNG